MYRATAAMLSSASFGMLATAGWSAAGKGQLPAEDGLSEEGFSGAGSGLSEGGFSGDGVSDVEADGDGGGVSEDGFSGAGLSEEGAALGVGTGGGGSGRSPVLTGSGSSD